MQFDQRQADAATGEINTLLCPLMDKAIEDARKAEYDATRGSGEGDVAAKRIGAGYIGLECERELGFRYHRFPQEPRDSGCNPGELTRHGEAGHWTEKKTAEWLALTGIIIETIRKDGNGNTVTDQWGKPKQIGWKDAKDPASGKYRMAGEVDGVITYVRDNHLRALINPPCIWESKKATDKKWKKFCKEKVRGADPVYFGQIQTNMGYLGVTQTLFSMLNLDTMKYYYELIAFDQMHAQGLVNRAVGVFNTKSPMELPRIGRTEDDFKCKFCDYHDQCWHGLVIEQFPHVEVRATVGGPDAGITTRTVEPFNPNLMDDPPF
jgi:hypothetical protein